MPILFVSSLRHLLAKGEASLATIHRKSGGAGHSRVILRRGSEPMGGQTGTRPGGPEAIGQFPNMNKSL